MGIRISTDDYGVKVWRSDKYGFPQYAVAISTKTESGERISEYKQVQFRRGIELENGDEIYIDNAFPTLRTWKDKQTGEERYKEVWMITDFKFRARYEEEPNPTQANASKALEHNKSVGTQASFDDLPDTFAAAEDDIPF